MTYATGSGSVQSMIDSLATFALANGWSPRTTSAHRYWSILGRTYDDVGTCNTEVDLIEMAESSGGANILTGGTASATAGTAANALVDDGTLWSTAISGTPETRWTYDLGVGNSANVVEVRINFATAANAWRFFDLQFSDDGSTWTTLKSFRTGITTANQTFTGLWENDDWPLSPDGDNYLAFHLDTGLTSTGYTLEGGSFPITDYSLLYMNIGQERLSPLTLQGSTVRMPTVAVDEWHFFGDDTSAAHINVAFRLTYNGSSFWHHFSAGLIDKRGMTHNGVAYCTSSLMCALIESIDTSVNASVIHSTLDACGYFVGRISGSPSSLCYRLTQTGGNFPYPNDGNFPARDETHLRGFRAMPTLLAAQGARRNTNQLLSSTSAPPALGSEGWRYVQHPTTGFVTLGALPLVIGNSADATTADLCWLGEFPNVRTIRMDNLEPAAEITVGSDTWMCFPLLRKFSAADAAWPDRVAQSGPAGIAYKKVA